MSGPLILTGIWRPITGAAVCVDEADAHWLDLGGWYLCNGYARRDFWENGQKRRVYLHRLIANPPAGLHVDHVNRDKLDNRRRNLRVVTRSENLQNRRGATRTSRTGVRGVFQDTRDGAYYARVTVNGRRIDLGRFRTLADAETAVTAARRHHMTHSMECAS